MNRKTGLTVVLTIVLLSTTSMSVAQSPDRFIGRWALTIPGGAAGWLGVEQDGAGYKSQILWGGGSVVPTNETNIEDDTLTIERHHNIKRKDAAGKTTTVKRIEKIIAKVAGDNLLLTQIIYMDTLNSFERLFFPSLGSEQRNRS